jgi:hypothetical protein
MKQIEQIGQRIERMKRMAIWEFMMHRQIRYALFEFPPHFYPLPQRRGI